MTKAVLGIIGGSGFYDLPGLEGLWERRIPTPQDLVARAAEAEAIALSRGGTAVCVVTDYDWWHPTHDSVEVVALLRVMDANRDKAQRLFAQANRVPGGV